MKEYIKTCIAPSLKLLFLFTLLLGIFYPLFIRTIGILFFKEQAEGSLLRNEKNQIVGSKLIGQNFYNLEYFHPRISYAGADGYDGVFSDSSFLGPTSRKLIYSVANQCAQYRKINLLSPDFIIPSDAVTSSASGLDPHISVDNAMLQVQRVANERNISPYKVALLIQETAQISWLSPTSYVNVLELNLALDQLTE
ncbi:MAG: K(+)-transporting ATPase subunit C [Chlamydiae bacterium]|nr:K(+)-transporting ATPase subunit C [Chlamydiota bacterium]